MIEMLKDGLNGCGEKTVSWIVNTTKEMPGSFMDVPEN